MLRLQDPEGVAVAVLRVNAGAGEGLVVSQAVGVCDGVPVPVNVSVAVCVEADRVRVKNTAEGETVLKHVGAVDAVTEPVLDVGLWDSEPDVSVSVRDNESDALAVGVRAEDREAELLGVTLERESEAELEKAFV